MLPYTLALLEIKNLAVEYSTVRGQVRAINEVSLQIEPQQVMGVVGESGCGKSSLGLSVIGLLPVPPAKYVKGSILYKGLDLLKIPRRSMKYLRGTEIFMIFQEPLTALNPVLTIGTQMGEAIAVRKKRNSLDGKDYIAAVAEDRVSEIKLNKEKIKGEELKKDVIDALKLVRIPDPERICGRYPHELSGGMRQRICIGMALSEKPSLLIADEPTSALDVTTQAEILRLIMKLVDELHTSVIFVTHDLATVEQVADRIAVMYAGEIVEEGPAEILLSAPQHPYTTGLISSFPSGYKDTGLIPSIPGTIANLAKPPTGCKFHPRCRYTFDPCSKEIPELMTTSPGHTVACYLYGNKHE